MRHESSADITDHVACYADLGFDTRIWLPRPEVCWAGRGGVDSRSPEDILVTIDARLTPWRLEHIRDTFQAVSVALDTGVLGQDIALLLPG